MKEDFDQLKNELLFGTRPAIEAMDAGKQIENIFIQRGLNNPLIQELKQKLKERQVYYKEVPVEKLNKITGKNHQGVICFISPIYFANIENVVQSVFEEGRDPFILILDRITDVRNFGAIARTAACAGVDTLVIPSRGSAQINADAVKTSAGALLKIPVCKVDNLKTTARYLQESGMVLIAATEKSNTPVFSTVIKGPLALIMGSEEDGISDDLIKIADHLLQIPMSSKIASLNVSVATGIMLFEMIRQRGS